MSTPIQILNNAAEAVAWLRSRVQGDLHTDSRKVKAGDAFVAWPGAATDGRAYVGKAVEQGAAARRFGTVLLGDAVLLARQARDAFQPTPTPTTNNPP